MCYYLYFFLCKAEAVNNAVGTACSSEAVPTAAAASSRVKKATPRNDGPICSDKKQERLTNGFKKFNNFFFTFFIYFSLHLFYIYVIM